PSSLSLHDALPIWRTPEDQAGQPLVLDHAGQRPLAFQQMILADDLVEAFRAQTICERCSRRDFHAGGGEKGFAGSTRLSLAAAHARTLNCRSWPFRRSTTVHWLAPRSRETSS